MTKRPQENQINTRLNALKQKYGDEANHVSKAGFPFNVFDNIWTLDGLGAAGTQVNWNRMHEKEYSDVDLTFILMLIADKTATLSATTIAYSSRALEALPYPITDVERLKRVWTTLPQTTQNTVIMTFGWMADENPKRFSAMYQWALKRKKAAKFKGYDVEKGAYSDIENQSISTGLNQRINALQASGFVLKDERKFIPSAVGKLTTFALTLGNLFLIAIVRRPAQLIQLKWNDIIPVGASFGDSRISTDNEYDFSDIEKLQIRMYKAKTGAAFRGEIEIHPLYFNHNLSKSVLFYRKEYQRRLLLRLDELGIYLSDEESIEIMSRCPVFYHDSLFRTEFVDKQQLFSAVSQNGQGFHLKSNCFITSLNSRAKTISFKSDRIPNNRLNITNNRVRHTVISNGVRQGLDDIQLAKITNVTIRAVKPYIDFSHEARVLIDNKFNKNNFLINAFSVTVSELKQRPEFAITDEFDQEMGRVKGLINCKSCKLKHAKPMGCYGCDNFIAMHDADHQSQLCKAQLKLKINQEAGESEPVLQKLKIQIYWIDLTIRKCAELIIQSKGVGC